MYVINFHRFKIEFLKRMVRFFCKVLYINALRIHVRKKKFVWIHQQHRPKRLIWKTDLCVNSPKLWSEGISNKCVYVCTLSLQLAHACVRCWLSFSFFLFYCWFQYEKCLNVFANSELKPKRTAKWKEIKKKSTDWTNIKE